MDESRPGHCTTGECGEVLPRTERAIAASTPTDAFVVFARAPGLACYPNHLAGGPFEVRRLPPGSTDGYSLLVSGGYMRAEEGTEACAIVLTGLVTAMDALGARITQRVIGEMVAPSPRVAVLHPDWGDITGDWPRLMRDAGFEFEYSDGKDDSLAVGSGERLGRCAWLENAFWGASSLVMASQGSACTLERLLLGRSGGSLSLRDELSRIGATVSKDANELDHLLAGATVLAWLGGPDGNNLSLVMLPGCGIVFSDIPDLMVRVAEGLGIALYDAGHLGDVERDDWRFCDLPDFLVWRPVPRSWRCLV